MNVLTTVWFYFCIVGIIFFLIGLALWAYKRKKGDAVVDREYTWFMVIGFVLFVIGLVIFLIKVTEECVPAVAKVRTVDMVVMEDC